MIILEAGLNHFGNLQEAEKIMKYFLNSEFDYLTFQIQTKKFYKKFEKKINFKLPESFYKKAVKLAHTKKKKIGLAVCDLDTFKEVSKVKFDFYKLLGIAINNYKLIDKLRKTRKQIFISLVKGSNKRISNCIKSFKKKNRLNLVYTSMSHDPRDLHLKRITELKKKFNLPTGYGHHYKDLTVFYMSMCFDPSCYLIYIKNFTKNNKRVFPDDEHAIFTNQLDNFYNKFKELNLILQNGKINTKIKLGDKKISF